MFTVEIKKKALKKLTGLNDARKQEIRNIVLTLKKDPVPFRLMDIRKLKGYDNTYRVRVGSSRVVYDILWDERKITIHYIGPRSQAYKRRI